jgi:alpha-tubulin suppressor-like RCC1 family protein
VDLDGNRLIDSADETVGEQYVCNVYPVSVSADPRHSSALASNGTDWCWGDDSLGQLGIGIASPTRSTSEPQLAVWHLVP